MVLRAIPLHARAHGWIRTPLGSTDPTMCTNHIEPSGQLTQDSLPRELLKVPEAQRTHVEAAAANPFFSVSHGRQGPVPLELLYVPLLQD